MIIVTGGAGFIGSCLVKQLNLLGFNDILVVDKLYSQQKWLNITGKDYYDYLDRDYLLQWLNESNVSVDAIFHMGACSSTEEENADYIIQTNYQYSKQLWEYAVARSIDFIFASSAATYGDGRHGFVDRDELAYHNKLIPLNPYALSKLLFDRFVIKQDKRPRQWVGFKFFNVFGPNEQHKGRGASMAYHLFNQARDEQLLSLYKSYKPEYADGQQIRDFVYIKDVVDTLCFAWQKKIENGFYNLGSGVGHSFNDLAGEIIKQTAQLGFPASKIQYIEMPVALKAKYQYTTIANMEKLKAAGYDRPFYSLKEGVHDYIHNYLHSQSIF